jgi:hypothetical protein
MVKEEEEGRPQGKNKFIKKISSLISCRSSQASVLEESCGMKNSAKESRERKKKYI